MAKCRRAKTLASTMHIVYTAFIVDTKMTVDWEPEKGQEGNGSWRK
jgi:hypothetical protein